MDRRSWPWKKKLSEKSAAEKAIATLGSASGSLSGGSQAEKDNYKKPNYVQISVESYSHLTGLENQVKSYEKHAKIYEEQSKTYEEQLQTVEDENNELNEKLASATSEITSKEELVKQHVKVAEDAVSGWEKAEAEALTLKNCLQSVTLEKLTVEDRAAHLDNALKECMRQIRNLKEENEHKLQELSVTKNKQYDRMKHDLETKIAYMDQDLMRAENENAAISRSLQERSNMLIKVSEEKSRAEAQIELLKSNVKSCEREINSLKYELNIVSKEMEIRNEEKNMCVKTAEMANKHQLESVKTVAKLEAECQRLRGLVRKKLPGPAALAQMKIEVESLGRDYGDHTLKKSQLRPSSPQFSSNLHMLSVPELSLDGVQKFHKENEFLTARLLAMEEETQMLKEALAKRNCELQTSRSICAMNTNKLQSLEAQLQALNLQKVFSSKADSNVQDGNDDAASCAESWSSSSISDLSNIKEKNKGKSMKSDNGSHLEFMDDFEEMEKFARNGSVAQNPPNNSNLDAESSPLGKLQSKISRAFKSISNESDVAKILEDIKHAVQEMQDNLHPRSKCPDDAEKGICWPENGTLNEKNDKMSRKLATTLSQIHNFVLSLGKEARTVHESEEGYGMSHKVEKFSVIFNRVLCNEIGVDDFVFALSDVLDSANELRFDFLGRKVNEEELNSPACIDKVALPENKLPPQGESYSNDCGRISYSSFSNPEVPQEANILLGFEPGSCKCSVEEFEQLKAEKDSMERVIFRCSQDLEVAKSQLMEMGQNLSEIKSELTSSRNMNSLAETQLKCMTESYKSLEKRAKDFEDEVNILHEKLESLNNELETERTSHQDALTRCRDLEEQLQRDQECPVCSSSAAEVDNKAKQEKELEMASEKLAECQETIFLLGKQLTSMRPPEFLSSPNSEPSPKKEGHNELKYIDQVEMDTASSPMDIYNATFSPSEADRNITRSLLSPSKNPTHRSTKSGSPTSTPTPEKHSRGFSRFFSTKQ